MNNLQDLQEAKPYIRCAMAFLIYLVRHMNTPESSYNLASKFIEKLEKELKENG